MVAQTRIVNVEPDSETARLLDSVGNEAVVAVVAGHRFRILRERAFPFEDYDPERVRQSIRKGFGGFKGIRPEELISELKSLREQHDFGRSDE